MHKLKRIRMFVIKEFKQLTRDRLSLIIGLILPAVLLLIFGYGISMDIKNIRMTIVAHENSNEVNALAARFQGSSYFEFQGIFRSTEEARRALGDHKTEACLYLPHDFARRLRTGDVSMFLVVTHPNISRARMVEAYVSGIVGMMSPDALKGGNVTIQSRMWFNDANDSRYYLLPGVVVMVMTMIGALLTSLVMAREYEHGNLESMFISPMRPGEIIFAKALINFMLGMIGLAVTLFAAKFMFGVPFRGNIAILVLGSALYLIVALGIGLVISSVTKNQFIACQLTLVLTFMPALLLSGFIYEINNMPVALQWFTMLIPARYYVEFLQTVFLAGDVWEILFKDMGILLIFALILMTLAVELNPKSLE